MYECEICEEAFIEKQCPECGSNVCERCYNIREEMCIYCSEGQEER